MPLPLFTITRGKDPATGTTMISRPARSESFIQYRVTFPALGATPADVKLLGPDYYSPLIAGSPEVLHEKNVRQWENDPLTWDLDCIYRLIDPTLQPAPANPAGQRWAINYTISSLPQEVPTEFGITSDFAVDPGTGATTGIVPLANTAGELIHDHRPQSDEEIIIEFSTDLPDWDGLDTAFGGDGRGSTNTADLSMTFFGTYRTFKANTLRFVSYALSWQPDPITGVLYPRLAYRLLWRVVGWLRRYPNMGYTFLQGGKPFRFMDATSVPGPFALDALGAPLALGPGVDMLLKIYKIWPQIDMGVFLHDLST